MRFTIRPVSVLDAEALWAIYAPYTLTPLTYEYPVPGLEEFARRYREELDANPAAIGFANHCGELLRESDVTLVYGARSATCNHAVILREWIIKRCEEIR